MCKQSHRGEITHLPPASFLVFFPKDCHVFLFFFLGSQPQDYILREGFLAVPFLASVDHSRSRASPMAATSLWTELMLERLHARNAESKAFMVGNKFCMICDEPGFSLAAMVWDNFFHSNA